MLPDISLTLRTNRKKIKNFEEDKEALLASNPGLRYDGLVDKFKRFSGQYYLLDADGKLIEPFQIIILVENKYPNTFPIVVLCDEHFEKSLKYHMNEEGCICLEHTYVANALATTNTLRITDFVNYYLPRYFSWALVKEYGDDTVLQEWDHHEKGTIELYQILIGTHKKEAIKTFLEHYLKEPKPRRNTPCYCGKEESKLKDCHWNEALFLHSTSRAQIIKDLALFD